MQKLSIGISPCPNDTFIFGAMCLGSINIEGVKTEFFFQDVEELNHSALRGEYHVVKTSVAIYGRVRERYRLLDAGAALGRGVGPLLVARRDRAGGIGSCERVAIPGKLTTAYLLFKMAQGDFRGEVVAMRYDEIFDALHRGEVDAGVVIHEGRFTYQQRGLVKLMDLGRWWEERTSLPVPLGCILARRDIERGLVARIEDAIRESILFAKKDVSPLWGFIKEHAREMEDEVIAQHIKTFVTDYSLSLGREGKEAIERLVSFV